MTNIIQNLLPIRSLTDHDSSEGNGSNQRTECKLPLKRKCKQTSNTKFYSDGVISSKRFKYNESSMSNQNIAANYTSHVNDDEMSEGCSAEKSKNHKQQFHADIMKSFRGKQKLLNKIKQWRVRH